MSIRYDKRCLLCNTMVFISFEPHEMESYGRGDSTSKAFPNMHDDDRTFISTGICAKCHLEQKEVDDQKNQTSAIAK